MDIISEGKVRQMAYNAMGVKVEVDDAHLIGTKIRDELLPKLEPDKRIYADGTITEQPDDMTLFKDDDEQWKNYSVSYEWLKDFSDFCLQSKGFQIFLAHRERHTPYRSCFCLPMEVFNDIANSIWRRWCC